ncbi:MAG: transcriptional repressor [Candidatus Manganitrophus sp.]|nr:MAG: transcriptional repressor [Candidatus Manganitrophus sp.]
MGPSFRKSRQRQIILDTLSDMRTHPTAQEIFARVREIDSQVGQATVYRNLRILKEQGEIIELSFGTGEKRYDRNVSRHEHFTCRRCGKIEDIYPNYRSLTGSLSEKGFQIDEWRIEAFGICRGCIEPNQPH